MPADGVSVHCKFGPVGRWVSAFRLAMHPAMTIKDLVTPGDLRDTNAAIHCMTTRARR